MCTQNKSKKTRTKLYTIAFNIQQENNTETKYKNLGIVEQAHNEI